MTLYRQELKFKLFIRIKLPLEIPKLNFIILSDFSMQRTKIESLFVILFLTIIVC
jgi:hypothetical protein